MMVCNEFGVPEAIAHLCRLYDRLEEIRKDLGQFVSYEDEGPTAESTDSILGKLTQIIKRAEDTTHNIRVKVDSLLEVEPK